MGDKKRKEEDQVTWPQLAKILSLLSRLKL